MFQIIKILGIAVILAIGAALGVGFTQDTRIASETPILIDAPIDDVWEIVSDPNRAPEWLPAHMGPIERVEMRADGHSYVGPKGSFDAKVVVSEGSGKKRKYKEAIVAVRGSRLWDLTVESLTWGFELSEEGAHTKLTFVREGVAKKPIGVFLKAVAGAVGMTEKDALAVAQNVQAVAKGKKKKS